MHFAQLEEELTLRSKSKNRLFHLFFIIACS